MKKFDPINDPQSGYSTNNNFWHLKDMLKYISKKKIKPEKIHIKSIHHQTRWTINAIEMAQHYERIRDAEYYPIIINRDGQVIDGYHRIAKAIYENKERIEAYRIDDMYKIKHTKKS